MLNAVRVHYPPHCLRECSKSWQTTCRMIAVRWTGFERRSPFMLIRITCRYKMLNWQQVIEVERLGGQLQPLHRGSCGEVGFRTGMGI
jgi:hypothetical protein